MLRDLERLALCLELVNRILWMNNGRNGSDFFKSWVDVEVFNHVGARSAKPEVLESPGGLVKVQLTDPTPGVSGSKIGLCSCEKGTGF